MKRRINLKLLLGLFLAVMVLAGGAYGVHKLQVQRNVATLLAEAEQLEDQGEPERAKDALERYLAYRPNDTTALIRYGKILEAEAETDEQRLGVIRVYQRAIRGEPQLLDTRRDIAQLALALANPDFETALPHLEVLERSLPEDAEIQDLLGQCRMSLGGQFEEARRHFEKAIELDPSRVETYVRLANLLRTELDDEARANWLMNVGTDEPGGVIAENPDSAQAYLARARYREQYDIEADQAPEDIARALELDPEDADVLLAAGMVAASRGELDTARESFQQGLQRHPENEAFYQMLAEIEMEADRPEEAVAWLEQGFEALPETNASNLNLRFALAELLIRVGRLDDVETTIEALREQGLRPEFLQFLNARVQMERGQWTDAARNLETALLELAPRPESRAIAKQALLLLGQCHAQNNDLEQRLDAYRRAVDLPLNPDPYWVQARLGLAGTLAEQGNLDQAIREYRLVLPRAPQLAADMARLLILQNLRVPEPQRRWPEVERLLDQAEANQPESIAAPILRAEMLAAQGRLEPARDLLNQLRDRDPERLEPWLALVGLAEREGQPEQALALLDQASQRLGDRVELQLARVGFWSRRGGDQAPSALKALGRESEALDNVEDRERLQRALASALLNLGLTDQAREVWGRLAEQRPDDLEVQRAQLGLALQAGEESAAHQALNRLQEIEGEEGTLWRYGKVTMLIQQARSSTDDAQRKARLDQADQELSKLTSRQPDWAPAVLARAEIDLLRGNQNAALRNYLRAIHELGDRTPSAIATAAQLLNQRGRAQEADRMLTLLRGRNVPISGDLQRLEADIAFRNQDFERAARQAADVVSDQSDDPRELLWLGRVRWATGQDAEPVLRRAVERGTDNPATWLTLIAYLAETDRAKAEAVMASMERRLPEDRVTLALAQAQEMLGQGETAQRLYEQALEAQPDDLTTLQRVSAFHLRGGRVAEAQDLLRQIIEQHPDTEAADSARRGLALVTAAGGGARAAAEALEILGASETDAPGTEPDPDAATNLEDLRTKAKVLALQPSRARRQEAIAVLNQVIEQETPNAADLFLLAQLQEATGDWDQARQTFRRLLETYGQNPVYLSAFIRSLLRHDDVAGAQFYLRRLEEIAPEQPGTVEVKGRVLTALGFHAEAVRHLKAFAGDDPNRFVLVARLLEELKHEDAAEELYRAFADQKRAEQPSAVFPLAGFLGRQGQTQTALDLLDESLWRSLPPEQVSNASVVVLYGAKGQRGPLERVAQRLERAIDDHPDRISIQFDLANVRVLQGQYDEAEAIYLSVHDRYPSRGAPLNNLAYLLAMQGERTAKALEYINQAIELEGETPELLDTRALVHLALDQPASAIRDLESALTVVPNNAEMYFHLALAHRAARRNGDAEHAFRQAQELGLIESRIHPLEREQYNQLLRNFREAAR